MWNSCLYILEAGTWRLEAAMPSAMLSNKGKLSVLVELVAMRFTEGNLLAGAARNHLM